MYYKNTSNSVKTFHGVTFNPGDTKEVNQYINHRCMIRVASVDHSRNIRTEDKSDSKIKSKKDAVKPEPSKPQKKEAAVLHDESVDLEVQPVLTDSDTSNKEDT